MASPPPLTRERIRAAIIVHWIETRGEPITGRQLARALESNVGDIAIASPAQGGIELVACRELLEGFGMIEVPGWAPTTELAAQLAARAIDMVIAENGKTAREIAGILGVA